MAERSGFFNALETEQGVYDRTYNAEDFSKLIKQVIPTGIYVTDEEAEQGNIDNTTVEGLKPYISGSNIIISPGKAIVDGFWYENTSDLLIPFPTIGTKKLVLLSYVAKDRKVYVNLADWDGSDDSIVLRKTDGFYDVLLGTFVYDSSTTKVTDKREQFITASFRLMQYKIDNIGKKIFPVGSLYMSVNNVNPGIFLGGVWEEWGKGCVPVGVDTSQTEFETVEKKGGEKTHKLSVNEIPPHDHPSRVFPGSSTSMSDGGAEFSDGDSHSFLMTGQTGGGQAHNNLQPYITCYFWKRVS